MSNEYDDDEDVVAPVDAFQPLETIPNQTAQRNQMAELHQLICLALSARIRAGIWSSGDIAAATKFLKDNNITADVGDNKALQKLREDMEAKQKSAQAKGKTYLTEAELIAMAQQELANELWH